MLSSAPMLPGLLRAGQPPMMLWMTLKMLLGVGAKSLVRLI